MSAPLEFVEILCPYCGQGFETSVDLSAGAQSYYEDCQVCCAPICIGIELDARGELSQVHVRRDDD